MDGYAAPHVLLMETHTSAQRFAEHTAQLQQLNAQLFIQQRTENRLLIALQTADVLRREIIHRVKNNLSIVSALLRAKARSAEHPAATEALLAAAARINSMAIVHDILDATSETEIVKTKALFSALLDHLRDAICPPHITLECEAIETELETEAAMPLCLLLNELVTNAIKHAFKGQETGVVRVTFAETLDGFQLMVADNGSGIDEEATRKGAGSRIIEALVQQLQGEVAQVSRVGGTSWSLTLRYFSGKTPSIAAIGK
ncbi:two-component sensor histidine kinase [Hoeflea halophila]|uniref:histidine kinase n=2 Tax=Hoeflea halophila TaxID=714899 RepID=A0A286IG00_9HYPH|nr:two-component sensor histidine kinase [Hoeflea halophila]